jgi:hypothetical protein
VYACKGSLKYVDKLEFAIMAKISHLEFAMAKISHLVNGKNPKP